MPERRRHKRVSKRLHVEYGVDALDERGLIMDISVGGIFIAARRLHDIGTLLHLHIHPPGRDFYAEGRVVRQRRVDPRLIRIEKGGMGVRFINPAEIVRSAVPKTERTSETNAIVCHDVTEAEALLRDQLSSGLLLVPIDDPTLTVSTDVEFAIEIEFANVPPIEGVGRVVQVLNPPEGPRAVVQVKDAAELRERLESVFT